MATQLVTPYIESHQYHKNKWFENEKLTHNIIGTKKQNSQRNESDLLFKTDTQRDKKKVGIK